MSRPYIITDTTSYTAGAVTFFAKTFGVGC